jgi:hypothetical protein
MATFRLADGTGRRLSRQCLATLLLLCLQAGAALADEWRVALAPSGDTRSTAATTTNADGHRLFVWAKHLADRTLIFAEIQLKDGVEFAGRMPAYTIDNGKAINTEYIRRAGEKQGSLWGFVAGRDCFWLIWASNAATVDPADHLAKWMGGKRLTVSYQAAEGGSKETEFSLQGARTAIEQATDVALH